MEKSIGVKETYYNLMGKARLLVASGKKADGIAMLKKAIATGQAAQPKADTAPGEAMLAEWEK